MRNTRRPFAFPVDNKEELILISNVLKHNASVVNPAIIPIITDAVTDAIESVKDPELAIRTIITNHSELIPHLGKVIKDKFPEHQDLFDKLTILT